MPRTIQITWSVEDVKEVAPDLTTKEAERVLEIAKDEHDANIGINWDVLGVWADFVRNERGE